MTTFHEQDTSHTQLKKLLDELMVLHCDIISRAENNLDEMQYEWPSENRLFSAINLSMYVALRHHDIRPIQDKLAQVGISSLGRVESNILDNIELVIDILSLVTGSEVNDFVDKVALSKLGPISAWYLKIGPVWTNCQGPRPAQSGLSQTSGMP